MGPKVVYELKTTEWTGPGLLPNSVSVLGRQRDFFRQLGQGTILTGSPYLVHPN